MERAKPERRGNVEVRPNANGTVDEVIVYADDGRLLFHLEQMGDATYWMRAEAEPGAALVVNLWAGRPGPNYREDGKVELDERHESDPNGVPPSAVGSMYEWDTWDPAEDESSADED